MNPVIALVSLIGLILTILIGIVKPKLNIGIIALAVAYLIGIVLSGLTDKQIALLFPSSLFLTLAGVTVFFNIADVNGLLDQLAKRSVKRIGNNVTLIPVMFFVFAFILSAIGPGNIAATAMLAPLGMAVAYKYGANPLLMAIMICTGANAGAFSPVAPTGVILKGLSTNINMGDSMLMLRIFLTAAFLQTISAVLAFLIFNRKRSEKLVQKKSLIKEETQPFTFMQKITLLAIILVILLVIFFKLPLSLVTFVAATFLLLINAADAEVVVKKMPWEAILLVTGVSVLIGVMEAAGGLELATTLIAKISSVKIINTVLTFITGVISAYSSSSGVVMPAFIPLIPGIVEKIGGDAVKMLIAIAVGSHMVDVSPLSTLGALCIANAKENKQWLFRSLMVWGLFMSVFASVLSYLFLDLF